MKQIKTIDELVEVLGSAAADEKIVLPEDVELVDYADSQPIALKDAYCVGVGPEWRVYRHKNAVIVADAVSEKQERRINPVRVEERIKTLCERKSRQEELLDKLQTFRWDCFGRDNSPWVESGVILGVDVAELTPVVGKLSEVAIAAFQAVRPEYEVALKEKLAADATKEMSTQDFFETLHNFNDKWKEEGHQVPFLPACMVRRFFGREAGYRYCVCLQSHGDAIKEVNAQIERDVLINELYRSYLFLSWLDARQKEEAAILSQFSTSDEGRALKAAVLADLDGFVAEREARRTGNGNRDAAHGSRYDRKAAREDRIQKGGKHTRNGAANWKPGKELRASEEE